VETAARAGTGATKAVLRAPAVQAAARAETAATADVGMEATLEAAMVGLLLARDLVGLEATLAAQEEAAAEGIRNLTATAEMADVVGTLVPVGMVAGADGEPATGATEAMEAWTRATVAAEATQVVTGMVAAVATHMAPVPARAPAEMAVGPRATVGMVGTRSASVAVAVRAGTLREGLLATGATEGLASRSQAVPLLSRDRRAAMAGMGWSAVPGVTAAKAERALRVPGAREGGEEKVDAA
jgi:hypothetical protein